PIQRKRSQDRTSCAVDQSRTSAHNRCDAETRAAKRSADQRTLAMAITPSKSIGTNPQEWISLKFRSKARRVRTRRAGKQQSKSSAKLVPGPGASGTACECGVGGTGSRIESLINARHITSASVNKRANRVTHSQWLGPFSGSSGRAWGRVERAARLMNQESSGS